MCGVPLALLEHPAFRQLLLCVNPTVDIPSPQYFSEVITECEIIRVDSLTNSVVDASVYITMGTQLPLFVCLFFRPPVLASVCLPVRLPICGVCLLVRPPLGLYRYIMSLCPPVCQSVWPLVCLSVCLSICLPIFFI